jgi:hypothetical protein
MKYQTVLSTFWFAAWAAVCTGCVARRVLYVTNVEVGKGQQVGNCTLAIGAATVDMLCGQLGSMVALVSFRANIPCTISLFRPWKQTSHVNYMSTITVLTVCGVVAIDSSAAAAHSFFWSMGNLNKQRETCESADEQTPSRPLLTHGG